MRLILRQLAKGLAAKGAGPGQMDMFGGGGGGGPKATVKTHVRHTKRGNAALVHEHQRTTKGRKAKPAQPKSKPAPATVNETALNAWKIRAAQSRWAPLLDMYIGDAQLAKMYIDRDDWQGVQMLEKNRRIVSRWLDTYALNDTMATQLLDAKDDLGGRTPQELDALARRMQMPRVDAR